MHWSSELGEATGTLIQIDQSGDVITLNGASFKVNIDKQTGTLQNDNWKGKELINGPLKPNL
jgi:alpha-acetolactate decarboxylase